jgi:4-hydroxy-tetrahydrodipicolinate reductase
MGKEVVKAIARSGDVRLVGAVDHSHIAEDAGTVAGIESLGVAIAESLETVIDEVKPAVAIDFTQPSGLMSRITTMLSKGVRPVVGTTGLSQGELEQIRTLAESRDLGAIVAPNFAVGALVIMKCCEIAARCFGNAEIVELHHPHKLDAPSGTAIKTAEMIAAARESAIKTPGAETERIAGARGGELDGVRIHSIRLPGLVAHQEVVFGNPGELFTVRHDSLNRESFMPGVLLAVREVAQLDGLLYGIESLVFGPANS